MVALFGTEKKPIHGLSERQRILEGCHGSVPVGKV